MIARRFALDERNEAATRTAIQQHALRPIRVAYDGTTQRSLRFPSAGPGSVSQAASREPSHEVVALVRQGLEVGRADRDDLMTMERRASRLGMTGERVSGWIP
jgi:hypothetical protein